MAKREGPEEEKTPENAPEESVINFEGQEINPETEAQKSQRIKSEEKEMESVRSQIEEQFKGGSKELVLPDEAEIKEYQEKYIPSYLHQKKENGSFLNHLMAFFAERFRPFEIDSGEKKNLPENGPFLVISNHFGGESPIVLSILKNYDTHLVAAEELHFKRVPLRAPLLRLARMISVKESLVNLSENEKEELVRRVPKESHKRGYRRVIEKEKQGGPPMNKEFIRQAVALLSRGDVVAMFPEGLMSYEKKPALQKAYGSMELIAGKFKELTGQELPIVPVAIFEQGKKEKRVRIGKPMLLSEKDEDISGTDWCMSNLAELLPEDRRGYYKDKSKNE